LVDALRCLELTSLKTSSRDIWFAAGKRAGQRQTRIWKLASAALGLVLAAILLRDSLPMATIQPAPKVVAIPHPRQETSSPADSSLANLKASATQLALLHAVADKGLSALPMSAGAPDVFDLPNQFDSREWFGDPALSHDDYENARNSRGGRQ